MQPLIYDVAVSIDGYIAGSGDDVSRFAHDGPVVDDYRARLKSYAMAIMGRRTYEFGYRYGLEPGQNPYPDMRSVVVSASIALPPECDIEVVRGRLEPAIAALKRGADGPVYLCGGGALAGAFLTSGLIDRIRLKRAPIVLGGGTRLFAGTPPPCGLHLLESRDYEDGCFFQEFEVKSRLP